MRRFWKGFAMGAGVGAGSALGTLLLGRALRRGAARQIVRLEKTLQIGRGVDEVFESWADLERLPRLMPMLKRIRQDGETSHWQMSLGGRSVEFDSEITQFLENEAIGWKSVTGPKHTGRVSFSPLGNDTVINVVMNYYPAPGIIAELLHPLSGLLEEALDQALRDFKASLEGKGQERAIAEREAGVRATGTYGASGSLAAPPRVGGETGSNEAGGPAEWTRPTEPPSTYSGTPNVPGEKKENLGD